jgi:hypothetical protein
MRSRRAFATVLTGLLAVAIGGGIYAEIELDGDRPAKASGPRRTHAKHSQPSAAHGLMLYPLADPDGHVHNGAEAVESTR